MQLLFLGDLLRFNGQYSEAIKEYENSLNLKKTICKDEESDREVAFLHFSIATALIYYASELISADKDGAAAESSGSAPAPVSAANLSACIGEKRRALSHYQSAHRILNNIHAAESSEKSATGPAADGTLSSSNASSSTAGSSVNPAAEPAVGGVPSPATATPVDDIKEMCDELIETLDALKSEIESQEKELGSQKKAQAITTTIGFGFGQNSGNTAPVNVFGNAFSSTSSSSSSYATATHAMPNNNTEGLMQVRKKVKPN